MASESQADARDTPRTPGPGVRSRLGRNSKNLSRSNLSAEPVRRAQAGGAGRDRTGDLKLAKLPLSQLSYGPEIWWPQNLVGPESLVGLGRLELPTSRLSSARSNQLSYRPERAQTAAP